MFREYNDHSDISSEDDVEFTCLKIFKNGETAIFGTKNGSLDIAYY